MMLFLEGRQEQVARALRRDMETASEALAVRAGGRPARQDARHRADHGEPEDGRLRQARSWTSWASRAGQGGGRAAVRHPRRQDHQPRRLPAGEPGRWSDEEALAAFVKQYYATGRVHPAARPRALPAARDHRAGGVPRLAARAARSSWTSRSAARAAQLIVLAARNAAETLGARAGQAGWPTRARPLGALEELADGARPGGPARCASSATTSAPSRARPRWAAWSWSRRAGRGPASTGGSGSGPSAGQNDFASHQEVLRRRFRRALDGEEGSAEELRWRAAGPRHHRRRQGPGERRARGARRAGSARPAHGRPGQGARGAVPARALRADRAARDLAGALYLLQRLRDEAHRFAITYHRKVRARRPRRSPSWTTCRASGRRASGRCCASSARPRRASGGATVDEIAAVPGIGAALAERSGPTWTPDSRRSHARHGGAAAAACAVPARPAATAGLCYRPADASRLPSVLILSSLPRGRVLRCREPAGQSRSRPSSAST